MNSTVIESLNYWLEHHRASAAFRENDLPDGTDVLLGTKYVSGEIRPPTQCFHYSCSASCTVSQENGQFTVICDLEEEPHKRSVPVDQYRYYSANFSHILDEIAKHVDQAMVNSTTDESRLPGYVSGLTEQGLRITMLVSPGDYQQTVVEIYMNALQNDQPTLLITSREDVEPLLELQSLFASGSLVFTVPFTFLDEKSEYIRKPIETMKDIQDMEQKFIQKRSEDSPHRIVHRANSNPRYILSELNHMRLLRVNKELPDHSGTRLEKVGEVAFSHLFPTYPESGGEDDRGKELPDQLFYIPELDGDERYESIFGIIDSKSGEEANFGDEESEGKHDVYIQAARKSSINADNIAHIFLILEFDGQQELEFHEKMSDHYGQTSKNEYMVIITADALAMLLSAYLAASVSNELQLIYGDFRKAIYPLFHDSEFKASGLGKIERNVGLEPEDYRDEYLQREDLLIIHREVVVSQLEKCLESPKDIEAVFEQYFRASPTI